MPLLMGGSLGWSSNAFHMAGSSCLISFHVMGCLSGPIGNLLYHQYPLYCNNPAPKRVGLSTYSLRCANITKFLPEQLLHAILNA
jgi:hypothetical protein